jgi:hypothetical protein
MLLSEFFKRLSYGELSNLSLGSEGAGTIATGKQNKIVSYTNEALLRLHSRFLLIEKDVLIEQQDGQTLYKLDSKYALSNTSADDDDLIYINDLGDPFQNDVIKIMGVTNALGYTMVINDAEEPTSLFTPMPDTLQVPHPIQSAPLSIIYQARHPIIPYDNLSAEIMLPTILEPALSKYVSYLTYSHMNGQENTVKAAEHMSAYESICVEINANDLMSSSHSTTNTRFEKGGWA